MYYLVTLNVERLNTELQGDTVRYTGEPVVAKVQLPQLT